MTGSLSGSFFSVLIKSWYLGGFYSYVQFHILNDSREFPLQCILDFRFNALMIQEEKLSVLKGGEK